MAFQKPNFFILGGPKCATTSISRWLDAHPEIFIADPKEPHYFSPDIGMEEGIKTIREYEKLYTGVQENHAAVGDASVFYLYSDVAVSNILQYQPRAKFIVSLRNPIEMAISLHAQEVWSRNENIRNFERAWLCQWKRAWLNRYPRNCERPKVLQYYKTCSLGSQLERLYSQIDSERVRVVFFDDIASSPDLVYRELIRFLEVAEFSDVEFKAYKTRKIRKNNAISVALETAAAFKKRAKIERNFGLLTKLSSFNIKTDSAPPSPWVTEMLKQQFVGEINKIEQITQRDLSHWLAAK